MKPILTSNKLRGGYYTPPIIAEFLCNWAIQTKLDRVIEPSCGDGVFMSFACKRMLQLGTSKKSISKNLLGIEYASSEARKAEDHLKTIGINNSEEMIHQGDFFEYVQENNYVPSIFSKEATPLELFDAVVGNPPFIRYQNFPPKQRAIAFSILESLGLKPNKLTNSWLPFLVISTQLLSKDGRLAMIVPAELFQVKYAAETRQFLSQHFRRITILTFRDLVFPEIQQEVVLLLCEKNHVRDFGIRTLELKNQDDLQKYDHSSIEQLEVKPINHSKDKWTQYFLNTDEIELLHRLRKNSKVTPLGKFIDVDVGVVTGCNDFFILRQSEYSKWRLNGSSLPIVSRSPHLKGLFFSKTDLENNYLSDYPALLFFPKAQSKGDLSNCDLRYISFGEENNYQSGYKCSIRDPWYIVPSVWIPDAFSLRQVHEYPKLVLNSSGATCTDTIHRIRFKDAHQSTAIVVSFLNSMTLAFSEVLGRSYGGGVLTFEPSEIEELPIFLPAKLKLNANNIDNLLRDRSIGSVLDSVDNEILINGLGLQSDTVLSLRNIWQKLKERRIGRK